MLGYLGPEGTFSHTAALEYSKNGDIKQYATIYSLILAVNGGDIDEGIVPIENSIEGSINVTLDTLAFDVDLYIAAEHILRISQNLFVKKGTRKEDIKKIMSHPQAIGQCSRILNSEFSDREIEFANSTSEAGAIVSAGDGSIACIGPKGLEDVYGLEMLLPDCGDESNNATRFVVLSKKRNMRVTDHDKTSIAFTVAHRPGCLYKSLEGFSESGINMLKIESRPLKKALGTYMFFIDIEGNIDNPTIYFALERLRKSTSFYKFLGSYEREITG